MKNRGFTLIELMIVIAIIAIFVSIGLSAFVGTDGDDAGYTENVPAQYVPVDAKPNVQCVDGLKFVDGKQVLNASGNGVSC